MMANDWLSERKVAVRHKELAQARQWAEIGPELVAALEDCLNLIDAAKLRPFFTATEELVAKAKEIEGK